MKRGKLIVVYGINNSGKTTLIDALADMIRKESSYYVDTMKCPMYDLEPFGPMIFDYIKRGNPERYSPFDLQNFYVMHRLQVQERLRELLRSGINILMEDYSGTGIAWGTASGINKEYLKKINSSIHPADISFLLDGQRYVKARERGHIHEDNDTLTASAMEQHRILAEENSWIILDAKAEVSTNTNIAYSMIMELLQKSSGKPLQ